MNAYSERRLQESYLWVAFAFVFPLIYWIPGYDSFHEPKWLALTVWTGLILIIRGLGGGPVFSPKTPLEPPILAILVATLVAWRWEAGDRWVAFNFWTRLVIIYLNFRLLHGWLCSLESAERTRGLSHLLNAAALGGLAVGLVAVAQDWGWGRWGDSRVSDWRFHLSSTLGNPNEVGGYLVYLTPILLARWITEGRWIWLGALTLGLYALSTVFTVGAWLGLFVILPLTIALFASRRQPIWKVAVVATFVSLVVFGVLRLLLAESLSALDRIGVLGFAVILSAGLAIWVKQRGAILFRTALSLTALLAVWMVLLPEWGIPNHPRGLVSEALESPRWKGGFGARRFIWETTGLMVKDHPVRGIGWGHYYAVHALYQGEVYRQRDLPHDRPVVGLVPQAHSDPLQVLAESGFLGAVCLFWLVGATALLGRRILARGSPQHDWNTWAAWTGLLLIFFHCLVDFPLRQPQPAFLATLYLSGLLLPILPARSTVPRKSRLAPAAIAVGVLLASWGVLGFRDQAVLKNGFEGMRVAGMTREDIAARSLLEDAARQLDAIRYPLPETHDRWLYRAQVAIGLGEFEVAKGALIKASQYRHSQALYDAWSSLAQTVRDPQLSLGAIRGMQIYNPRWWAFHQEEASILRLLGKTEEAARAQGLADMLKVPEKPMP